VKKISSNYKVILLELPGHDSITSDTYKSLNDYAEYFHNFIKFHNFSDLAILGFSLGGILTLQLLQTFPEIELRKAIIWASPITGLNRLLTFIKALYKIIIKLKIKINEDLVCKFSEKFNLNVTDTSVRTLSEFPPEEMLKNLNLIDNFEFNPITQIPTLFIFGSNDPFTQKDDTEAVKKKGNINWTVKSFKNGGHLGTNNDSTKIYKIINSFLNE
jgi:pimeloyl-ACP methyl ester carboxylesterase